MPSRHTDNQENQDPGQTEPPPEVSEHEQLQNALQTLKAMKRNKKEMKKVPTSLYATENHTDGCSCTRPSMQQMTSLPSRDDS